MDKAKLPKNSMRPSPTVLDYHYTFLCHGEGALRVPSTFMIGGGN